MGPSFPCRHCTLTYPVRSIWLSLAPSAACCSSNKCYLVPKNEMLVNAKFAGQGTLVGGLASYVACRKCCLRKDVHFAKVMFLFVNKSSDTTVHNVRRWRAELDHNHVHYFFFFSSPLLVYATWQWYGVIEIGLNCTYFQDDSLSVVWHISVRRVRIIHELIYIYIYIYIYIMCVCVMA